MSPFSALTVWGVARPIDTTPGVFSVRACPSREDAEIDAGLLGNVPAEQGQVSPLVYHHPDGKWVFAATGWFVPTAA